tara:strand:- start:1085 stop:1222 length:138 start_codon:yes stop_codon:yes gene_type:complete
MLSTIIFIILGVATFGILFFLFVKKALKKKLDYLTEQENKKNQLK